jgi:thiopeptide-type bacteriocin biosynthesis protein
MWIYYQLFLRHPKPSHLVLPRLRARTDAVLLDVLHPLVLAHPAAIKQMFFIRYTEGGYHLRLRFKGDSARICHEFVPEMTAAVNQHLLQQGLGEASDDTITPEIHQGTYEPEIAKYGGDAGVRLAEQHFCASSQFALRILAQERKTGVPRALWSLAFTDAIWTTITCNLADKLALIWSYGCYWLKGMPTQQRAMFAENNFAKGPAVQSQLQTIRKSALYRQWCEYLEAMLSDWFAMEHRGHLETPMSHYFVQNREAFAAHADLMERPITRLLVAPNFIHMLNNRLGISIGHESQLAYMLLGSYISEYAEQELPLLLEPDASALLQFNSSPGSRNVNGQAWA